MALLVVPRTRLSSIMTTRLPSSTSRTGCSFMRTASSRSALVGMMKERPA